MLPLKVAFVVACVCSMFYCRVTLMSVLLCMALWCGCLCERSRSYCYTEHVAVESSFFLSLPRKSENKAAKVDSSSSWLLQRRKLAPVSP